MSLEGNLISHSNARRLLKIVNFGIWQSCSVVQALIIASALSNYDITRKEKQKTCINEAV